MDEKIITMTDAVLSFLRDSLQEAAAVGVRVDVESGGCRGMRYAISFVTEESATDATDLVLDTDNIRVYISPKTLIFVRGMRMDYLKDPMGGRIVFENPNAKMHCGCGKSFCVNEFGESICKTCQ
ncbi:MAG: iron-sulfur cluster assembly accessory protein [Holosporaceae bacterium]|jgi:iron-sulfur cluster assembly protein|nr:iron-sulfur cluster assembly accessory protein [Holosporaceae bacterium]